MAIITAEQLSDSQIEQMAASCGAFKRLRKHLVARELIGAEDHLAPSLAVEIRRRADRIRRLREMRRERAAAADPLAGRQSGHVLRVGARRRAEVQRAAERRRKVDALRRLVDHLRAWRKRPCRRTRATIDADRLLAACDDLDSRLTLPEPGRLLDATAAVAVEAVGHLLVTRRGWSFEHRSRVGGGTSLYLRRDHTRLRISDHDVPATDERRHNAAHGRTCCDAEVVVSGLDTWREALGKVASETR